MMILPFLLPHLQVLRQRHPCRGYGHLMLAPLQQPKRSGREWRHSPHAVSYVWKEVWAQRVTETWSHSHCQLRTTVDGIAGSLCKLETLHSPSEVPKKRNVECGMLDSIVLWCDQWSHARWHARWLAHWHVHSRGVISKGCALNPRTAHSHVQSYPFSISMIF